MAKPLLNDKLWAIIEPLLPQPKPRRRCYPGRKPLSNRQVLTGILFVLKTGIPWEYLPQELGCGSGMTCWRRLRDWQTAGVWQKIHVCLLMHLRHADRLDWSRALVDSTFVRALHGGEKTGPNPTDRAKPGSKQHVLTEAHGIPLTTTVTSANTNDVTPLIPMVDAIPPIAGKPGQPRRRPQRVQGDRAYDSDAHRQALRDRGITPVLARRLAPHGSGLGKYRWVVERTIAWLHQFRRLRIRYERYPELHQAFVSLGCIIICSWFL